MNDHLLARSLHSATLRLLRRLRSVDGATALSPARLSVLSVLVFVGPRSISELARIEQVSQPTMSKLVSGLKGERLVRSVADPVDRRAAHVHPTAKGSRLLQQARASREQALVDLMAHLDPAERRTLESAADLMLDMLDDQRERA